MMIAGLRLAKWSTGGAGGEIGCGGFRSQSWRPTVAAVGGGGGGWRASVASSFDCAGPFHDDGWQPKSRSGTRACVADTAASLSELFGGQRWGALLLIQKEWACGKHLKKAAAANAAANAAGCCCCVGSRVVVAAGGGGRWSCSVREEFSGRSLAADANCPNSARRRRRSMPISTVVVVVAARRVDSISNTCQLVVAG